MELVPDEIFTDSKSFCLCLLSDHGYEKRLGADLGPHGGQTPSTPFLIFVLLFSQYMLHHGAGYTRLHHLAAFSEGWETSISTWIRLDYAVLPGLLFTDVLLARWSFRDFLSCIGWL